MLRLVIHHNVDIRLFPGPRIRTPPFAEPERFTSPMDSNVFRYFGMDVTAIPTFSAIAFGVVRQAAMALRIAKYTDGSRNSCRSSIMGSSWRMPPTWKQNRYMLSGNEGAESALFI